MNTNNKEKYKMGFCACYNTECTKEGKMKSSSRQWWGGELIEKAASKMCMERCEGFQEVGREGSRRREPIRLPEGN